MNVSFTKEQKELLNLNIIAIVSVISPKGFPYLTPIWFVEEYDKIYFSTTLTRTKGKFLKQNNNIGLNITHPDGGPYVSVVGKANIRTKDEFADYEQIVRKIFNRYDKTSEKEIMIRQNLNNKDRILVEIQPTRIFG